MGYTVTLSIPDTTIKRARELKINCSKIAREALLKEIQKMEREQSGHT